MTEAGGQSCMASGGGSLTKLNLSRTGFDFRMLTWPDWIERGKFKLMNKKLTVKPTKQKEYLQKLLEAEMQVRRNSNV